MERPSFEIDGTTFRDVDGFYRAFAQATEITGFTIANLDAFDDVLRGGYGKITEQGFTLWWTNSEVSKKRLGQDAYWQLVNILQSHDRNGKRARPYYRVVSLVLK